MPTDSSPTPKNAISAKEWRQIKVNAPDLHCPEPTYVRMLFETIGLSHRKLGELIGVNATTIVRWMQESDEGKPVVPIPYTAQVVLEILAQKAATYNAIDITPKSPIRSKLRDEVARLKRRDKKE